MLPPLLLLLRRCCYLLLPPQGAPGASSFILPLSRSDGCSSHRCGHRRSNRRSSCPVTDPGALQPPWKVCVCPRRGGGPLPAPPPTPVSRSVRTHDVRSPFQCTLGWGSSAGLEADTGLGRSVCARVGHVRAGCRRAAGRAERCGAERPGAAGCQPGERHGGAWRDAGPERCWRTGAWAEMQAGGGGVPETEAPGGRRLQAEPAVSAQRACRHATAAALAEAPASLPCACSCR